MKKHLSILILLVSIVCCSTEDEKPCLRIGANCNDGTTSTATGSGACAHHGGVSDWICKPN